jgi:1-deoxyxylulose-5-phosphate synthase
VGWGGDEAVGDGPVQQGNLLSKPAITSPIVGATKPNHLTDAVAALQVKLAAEEIASLEEPYVAHPVVGFS